MSVQMGGIQQVAKIIEFKKPQGGNNASEVNKQMELEV